MKPLLFTALAIVLAILIYKIVKSGKKKNAMPPADHTPDLANASITTAQVGDTVSLGNAGAEFDDLDVTVDRKDRYEDGDQTWYELRGKAAGRIVFIEAIDDDELEISYSFPDEEVALSDLGLVEEDLVRMDESQSRREGFELAGRRYSYASSGEIFWYKNSQGSGEGFYAWEFEGDGPGPNLTIEKWEGEAFKGTVAHPIAADRVKVWRA